jgi:delta24-sterol reductase
MGFKDVLADQLTKHRNLVIICIVLPIGFLFDLAVRWQRNLKRWLDKPSTHEERVAFTAAAVKARNDNPESANKLMCTARANWANLSVRCVNKSVLNAIPVGHLYHILDLNEAEQTCTVEPMVTMGMLSKYLAERGWFFAVTIEMDDVTIGGAAIAVGMTTHSHRVGLIQENVLSYEVVLGSGEVVTATKDENADLFYALPWSHGTLGFVTKMVVRIVKAKEYVSLTYTPIRGRAQYTKIFREVSERAAMAPDASLGEDEVYLTDTAQKGAKKPAASSGRSKSPPAAKDPSQSITSADAHDFIEMTIISPDLAVLVTGSFADRGDAPLVRQGQWWQQWWYRRVTDMGTAGTEQTEVMPLRDYLLRHNRSIFWVAADMVTVGNDAWFRFLLGWLMPPKPSFLKYTTTPAVRKMNFTHLVFQDITFPLSALEESLEVTDKLFDMYPLLVYPCRLYDHERGDEGQGQLRKPPKAECLPGTNFSLIFDLGIYGVPGYVRRFEPFHPVRTRLSMSMLPMSALVAQLCARVNSRGRIGPAPPTLTGYLPPNQRAHPDPNPDPGHGLQGNGCLPGESGRSPVPVRRHLLHRGRVRARLRPHHLPPRAPGLPRGRSIPVAVQQGQAGDRRAGGLRRRGQGVRQNRRKTW